MAHGKRVIKFPAGRGLTDRQYALSQALFDGGQLFLETRWKKLPSGKRTRSNGWYLHHRGKVERVNDNTVWTLRDRGLIEKRDFYAIAQEGTFKLRDEQNKRGVHSKPSPQHAPTPAPVVPSAAAHKTFKRIVALRA